MLSRAPEDARPNGVKGSAPHSLGLFTQEARDSIAHLTGSLVREGDRKDARRIDSVMLDQSRDAGGEHACFARTGSGQHEHRPLEMEHSFALCRIQTGKGLGSLDCGGAR